jgi:glycosyltransferase involved in cell wall biosynthesis
MTVGPAAKPRVLLRGPYPPPYGGIASLMTSLVKGLPSEGIEDVVVLKYGDENSVTTIDAATIYTFDIKSQAKRVLVPRNWPMFLHVSRALLSARLSFKELVWEVIKAVLVDEVARKHRSNVVNFYQSDVALEMLGCRAKWGKRRGVVLKVFGEIYDSPDFVRSRADLFRAMLTTPDAVTASSAHCARSFKQLGIDREIEVIYVGVDLDRFRDDEALRNKTRTELGVTDETSMLLFVGRFNKQMGLDALIDAVPELAQRGAPFKAILAGAKGDLTPAALECEKKYPNQVKVMNDVPGKQLPSLYAAADIVLTPSRDQHACMGVTIKEAMSASRAVIGSDSGGIPEAIVPGETGVIVPLQPDGNVDVAGFARAISDLMARGEERRAMGRKARIRAEDLFSETMTVKRTADVFKRCVPSA